MITTTLRFKRASWECLHFLSEPPVQAVLKEVEGLNFVVHEVDLARITSKKSLLDSLGIALKFPDYFGGTWDALADCLSDLGWLPGSGYILILRGSGQLWKQAPQVAGQLCEVWLAAAERWAKEDKPFHLVFCEVSS